MKSGLLVLALTLYQIKRAVKNPYMLLWLALVTGTFVLISVNWLPDLPLRFIDISLNSADYVMLGAVLLLPLLVRSFSPAFAAAGGVEFLPGKTRYLGRDVLITLLVNIIFILLTGFMGIMLGGYALGLHLSFQDVLLPVLFTVVPSLLLLITVILILTALLPTLFSAILFYLVVIGLSLVPGLAPWGELAELINLSSVPYTPLMLVNRLFCLLAAGLLLYIYIQVLKNQSNGLSHTKLRREQGYKTEERAVIISGQGLVLGNSLLGERLKKEMQIAGYPRILFGWLGAAAGGWMAHSFESAGLAVMGVVILMTTGILTPHNYDDYLLPGFQRRRWSFIILRTSITLLLVGILILIFAVIGSDELASRLIWGFFVVWGLAFLAAHYWNLRVVRSMASLFWIAMVFFPGALDMTISSYWWFIAGCLLILMAVILYRRNLYPE